MPSETENYWSATKHPWACVLFVLPMLAVYEFGLYSLGHTSPESMRNGADVWLRSGLAVIGVSSVYGAPCLLVFILLAWGLVRRDHRPLDKVGVWVGMVIESAAFAVLLVGLSQGLWLMLLRADHVLGQPSHRIALLQLGSEPEPLWGQIISYLGAGIYEETLFRLVLFAGLLRLLSWGDDERSVWGIALAAFASALLFAGAHHLGSSGEPFNIYVLAFRTFAGVYFAWLYHTRGFGIAVGAHAGYDVIVGLVLAR
jgi:membrane protease YdiL (CAAX protease family)